MMRATRRPGRLSIVSLLGVLLCVASLLTACGEDEPAAAQEAPAPEVIVQTMQSQSVPLISELPGRLESWRVAEVRARVAGIVVERLFTEGTLVAEGQPLYRIDRAPYQAAYDSALAQLARAEAALKQAANEVKRFQPLLKRNAISRQVYDDAVIAGELAAADLAAARAEAEAARINLAYTTVEAPIAGRIGRSLVTEGALVGQGEPTHLATIQQIDPIYVNFTQPAGQAIALREKEAEGRKAAVHVLFDEGREYPHPGELLFSDISVDPSSGQVTLRGQLPNPDGTLLPGMYVRVRLEQGAGRPAFLVPQQAITRSQQGDLLAVVEADGRIARRQVEIASARANNWVVVDGLADGDRVVVEGMKVRPGMTVQAVERRNQLVAHPADRQQD